MQRFRKTIDYKGFEIECVYGAHSERNAFCDRDGNRGLDTVFLDHLQIKIMEDGKDLTFKVGSDVYREIFAHCKSVIKEEV